MRSFIAASTMTKFFLPVFLMYSTRVTKAPALPLMNRPGSRRIFRPKGLSSGTKVFAYRSGVRILRPAVVFHHAASPEARASL